MRRDRSVVAYRKLYAQAVAFGGFEVWPPERTAGSTLIALRPTGGVLIRLTAAEAEVWLSGFVTGNRSASIAEDRAREELS
jgi:hypothetical protein